MAHRHYPAVCTLHRGITSGLLDRLDPEARLADFVAKDLYGEEPRHDQGGGDHPHGVPAGS